MSPRRAGRRRWRHGAASTTCSRGASRRFVTDPALTAEPLAHPGEVIKRSRGTTAEQIAALPDPAPRGAPEEGAEAPAAARKKGKAAAAKAPPKPVKRPPKPSRDALDTAEQALEDGEMRHRAEEKAFAERQTALDRERRDASLARGTASARRWAKRWKRNAPATTARWSAGAGRPVARGVERGAADNGGKRTSEMRRGKVKPWV